MYGSLSAHFILKLLDEAQGDRQKQTIRDKVGTYMERAEKIKKHLREDTKEVKKPVKVCFFVYLLLINLRMEKATETTLMRKIKIRKSFRFVYKCFIYLFFNLFKLTLYGFLSGQVIRSYCDGKA